MRTMICSLEIIAANGNVAVSLLCIDLGVPVLY